MHVSRRLKESCVKSMHRWGAMRVKGLAQGENLRLCKKDEEERKWDLLFSGWIVEFSPSGHKLVFFWIPVLASALACCVHVCVRMSEWAGEPGSAGRYCDPSLPHLCSRPAFKHFIFKTKTKWKRKILQIFQLWDSNGVDRKRGFCKTERGFSSSKNIPPAPPSLNVRPFTFDLPKT